MDTSREARMSAKASWSKSLIAGLILWLVAPVVAIAALSVNALTAGSIEPRPTYVEPVPASGDLSRPVVLGLSWGTSTAMPAPPWAGVVQKVYIKTGAPVADGEPIARIGGIERIAALTSMPFDRSLTLGDQGEDVSMLAAFLRARGIDSPETTVFTESTLQGVRDFAGTLGVPNAGEITAFDPSWVVFLPEARTAVSVEVTVGAPAPAAGSEIVALAPTLNNAVLLEEGTEGPAEASEIEFTPNQTASEVERLLVGGEEIPIDEARERVSEDGLSLLASLLSPDSVVAPANLVQPSAAGQWEMPAPALITGAEKSCVYVQRDGKLVEVEASPVVSFSGKVVVQASIQNTDKVTLFPTNELVTCG